MKAKHFLSLLDENVDNDSFFSKIPAAFCASSMPPAPAAFIRHLTRINHCLTLFLQLAPQDQPKEFPMTAFNALLAVHAIANADPKPEPIVESLAKLPIHQLPPSVILALDRTHEAMAAFLDLALQYHRDEARKETP